MTIEFQVNDETASSRPSEVNGRSASVGKCLQIYEPDATGMYQVTEMDSNRPQRHLGAGKPVTASFLTHFRQLAKCRIVRWRLVIPKDCACSIAVVAGSRWPVDKAKRAERAVETLGDGK